MIIGINHVTFGVTNLVESIRFYTEILGGNLRAKWLKGAYVELGTLWIALNVEDNGIENYQDNQSEGESYYFRDPDGNNLEIHVGDLSSRIANMKAKKTEGCIIYE